MFFRILPVAWHLAVATLSQWNAFVVRPAAASMLTMRPLCESPIASLSVCTVCV